MRLSVARQIACHGGPVERGRSAERAFYLVTVEKAYSAMGSGLFALRTISM
jgi:hypothetical protein